MACQVGAGHAAGFFLDADCRGPDPIADDQALFIDTTSGLVVIAGCAHAGVVNTLDRVSAHTGCTEGLALAGGLHLGRATNKEVEASASAIGRRNFQILLKIDSIGVIETPFREPAGTPIQPAGDALP